MDIPETTISNIPQIGNTYVISRRDFRNFRDYSYW